MQGHARKCIDQSECSGRHRRHLQRARERRRSTSLIGGHEGVKPGKRIVRAHRSLIFLDWPLPESVRCYPRPLRHLRTIRQPLDKFNHIGI
uniref:ATP-binding protein n=1 Tax=Burkholderia pseudomallei TaxID=28450 RepID=UPI003984B597